MSKLLIEQYKNLGISEEVYRYGAKIEERLKDHFKEIDERAEYNQMKVLRAMQENRVSAECFNSTSGYGYNDMGRDTLEKVYASCFKGEDALVRPQITCGTHALALALMSNLRPGDELLSPVGKPYDTLEEVIGIRPSKGSLAEYGITYSQVDLLPDGTFDYAGIKNAINERTKLVTIQRSKGYATRPTFSVKQIGELIAFVKNINPNIICMVDNCYGEFTEKKEPTEVGADLEGREINAGTFTFQIDVYDNRSQNRAKEVMSEVVRIMKGMRFFINSMPEFSSSNGIHRCTMRARRVIGSGDIL